MGWTALTASSSDERHPVSAVTAVGPSFWMTTGLFPQTFVLGTDGKTAVRVRSLTLSTRDVRQLTVETSMEDRPTGWQHVHQTTEGEEFRPTEGVEQRETITVNRDARYIKVTIDAGHGAFSSVSQCEVEN